jgi:hypothetical protein
MEIYLKIIGWEGVDWINLAWDRETGSCEHGNEPLDSINFQEFDD